MSPQQSSPKHAVSAGLSLVLAFLLFYGCRVFEPEPLLWNEHPDTILSGAPAETTGTRFLRHLYWYGIDRDGRVVRYIYAITDSTVQDPATLDVDEEDARFDPADDVRTLESNSWRHVGYTTRTDTTFLFTIDRGSIPSKAITFHIAAVDDKGGIDRTPARLHFFNNSLGNPVIEFTLWTWERQLDGGADWVKRWVGDGSGPNLAESPELTDKPVVGFARRFRFDWEASSPNGSIRGYRYQIDQSAAANFRPPSQPGFEKQWEPDFRSFVASNDVPPEDIPGCELDLIDGRFLPEAVCPPDSVRWPSDSYQLRVEAIDVALVESRPVDGELEFDVNYAPDTRLRRDAEWPYYIPPDGPLPLALTEGDTVPVGSYVLFDMDGNDRTADQVAPASYGELCCDWIQQDSTVSFQVSYDFVADREQFLTRRRTQRSAPFRAPPGSGEPDSVGFALGPFHYTASFVARDEHGRTDPTPELFEFTAGFRPRIQSTRPSAGDELLLWGAIDAPWPASLPATRSQIRRWWTGLDWVDDPARCRDPAQCEEVIGLHFALAAEFVGAPHPRDSRVAIRSWQFQNLGENDPENLFQDGLESKDLRDWVATGSSPNVWRWAADEALEIFVPFTLWFQPSLYEPCEGECPETGEEERRQGESVVRQLGRQFLTVRARTTSAGDTWPVYRNVRFDPSTLSLVPIGSAGRRSHALRLQWSVWVAIDSDADGVIDRRWPDFDPARYN